MALLTGGAIEAFTEVNPGWRFDGDGLIRTFEFIDFNEAMGFVNRVALVAESAFHHPDIGISWNKVTIVLSTHSEGGVTEKDTELAAKIGGFPR